MVFHKNFEKRYKKLPNKIKIKIKENNMLFLDDPFSPILNNHSLSGTYNGYRSINVTGNIRIIYKFLEKGIALFLEIGTHSKLYS